MFLDKRGCLKAHLGQPLFYTFQYHHLLFYISHKKTGITFLQSQSSLYKYYNLFLIRTI